MSAHTPSQTVTSWEQFGQQWDGVHNFLMGGACFPIEYELPPLERIVDELRRDPDARITPSSGGKQRNPTDLRDHFCRLPLERAMEEQFAMAHFKLANFYGQDGLLAGFEEQVMKPWQALLTAHGFTWTRCYPIIFISGRGCGSSYHMDFSHVLAWQRYGTKRWHSFKDPQRWAPYEMRKRFFQESSNYHEWFVPPADAREQDIQQIEMPPGSVLWNVFLTPHWVLADEDEVAMSINISHGGLRPIDGSLCQHERELEQWRQERQDQAAPVY